MQQTARNLVLRAANTYLAHDPADGQSGLGGSAGFFWAHSPFSVRYTALLGGSAS